MTEQEKNRLIKIASKFASTQGYEHSNGDVSYYSEKTEISTENLVALAKIALASLTAPPVKLPPKSDVKMGGDVKTRSLLTGMNMMRKSCAEAIRAAGYEVEE